MSSNIIGSLIWIMFIFLSLFTHMIIKSLSGDVDFIITLFSRFAYSLPILFILAYLARKSLLLQINNWKNIAFLSKTHGQAASPSTIGKELKIEHFRDNFLSQNGIQKNLSKEMELASKELDFEKAAVSRDRIKALTQIQTSQKINQTNLDEADVVSIYKESGKTCIQVFFFRSKQNVLGKASKSQKAKDSIQFTIHSFLHTRISTFLFSLLLRSFLLWFE